MGFEGITNSKFELLLHRELTGSSHLLSKEKNPTLDSGKAQLISGGCSLLSAWWSNFCTFCPSDITIILCNNVSAGLT